MFGECCFQYWNIYYPIFFLFSCIHNNSFPKHLFYDAQANQGLFYMAVLHLIIPGIKSLEVLASSDFIPYTKSPDNAGGGNSVKVTVLLKMLA